MWSTHNHAPPNPHHEACQRTLLHADPVVSGFVVAFTFGMAITSMVYMTAHISGGQLNPAVTIGCLLSGAVPPVQALANIVAQCVGTVLSACLLMALVPEDVREAANMGVNAVPDGSNVGSAFVGALVCPTCTTFKITCSSP